MKKILLILSALLLTCIGANAQTVVHECEAEFSDWSISGNSSGSFQRNTWSGETDASGMRTPFIEYWVGSGSILSDATISHTQLTGLADGYYEVSIFARAFNERSTTKVSEGITFTANDESVDLTTGMEGVYEFTDNGVDYQSQEVYDTYNLLVYVDGGTLDIGFTINGLTACDWMAFKNLEVIYLGDSPVGYAAHQCEAMLGHWSIEQDGNNGDFHLNTWSTEADPSGMVTPFLEYWVANGSTLSPATISHETITGLTAGYYGISVDIRIFSEAGNKITVGGTLSANSASEDLLSGSDIHSDTYGTETEVYGTCHLLTQVAEAGTLAISIVIPESVPYNWISFKNLKVVYDGATAPTLEYVTGTMNKDIETAMKAAIDAYNESQSADDYTAALAAIEEAEASVAYYAPIVAAVEALDEAGAAVWATSDYATMLTSRTLTDEDVSADLAAAQIAQTTENSDMSYVLTTGSWAADQGNGPNPYSTFATETYVESGEATSGKVLYCTVDGLQQGTYSVSFYAAANMANGVTGDSGSGISVAYANSETTSMTVGTNSGAQITSLDDMTLYTIQCKVLTGTLEFGIQNVADGGNWFLGAVNSLTLVSLGADVEAGDEVHSCVAEFSHWTQTYTGEGTNGTYAYNDWSTESDASGMVTPFLQTWVYQDILSDQTLKHNQLTGMPQGWYSVTVDARIMNETGEAITGTATFTANSDFIYLISDGSDGSYNGEAEEYGTYTVQCYVGDAGTLDIGFTIANANFNWLAWKNLSVVYLGETVEYNVGEATASETTVTPGQTVTLTFADCTKGDEDATLGVSSSASVTFGSTSVTLTPKGTITFTFEVPTDVASGEYTLTIPQNTIVWTLSDETKAGNAAQTITFTVLVPATIEEGDYLIVDAEGNYLGGGLAYGTEAAIIGKPQFIGFEAQENGTYHLDSHQYNSATAHYLGSNLYFDNATPVDWTLMEVDGGYAIYGTADTGTGYLTSNGFQKVASVESTSYTWTLVTMDDIVASMAEATEEAPVDVTALIASPEMKRNSNTTYYPTWTVSTGSVTFGQNSTIGGTATANCAESWHSENGFDVNQIITLPLAGTYKLSAQAFHTGDTDIVLYADDETANLTVPTTDPTDQAAAYQAFLEGTYPVDPITITTYSSDETVTIGFKGDNSNEWVVMGELDLQYLGVVEEEVVWTMTDANWGTLILPFAVTAVPDGLTIYTCTGTTTTTDEDTGESTTTVTVTAVTDGIAANTPYLVKGSVTEDTPYTFTGTPVEAEGTLTSGLLTGTYETLDCDALLAAAGTNTVYLLQNQGDGATFYPVVETESAEATLTPYHCYLTISSDVSPTALHLPGMSTGIVAVESGTLANDAIYDLSGRRVSKAVKGVYIQNGKKVLVK